MGKVFASPGVCSRKLTVEEQEARKPLWQRLQEASKAVMDAALIWGENPDLINTAKLSRAVQHFRTLEKR